MKTFAFLAFAAVASALELEDNYLAQVDVMDTDANGVTHPADSPLDRTASTKAVGKVSYQIFFDKKAEDKVQTTVPDKYCGDSFDEDIHMCCFKFEIYQPFQSLTGTDRYGMTVQHNCAPISEPTYGIQFHGFEFAVDGNSGLADASRHDYSLSATDNAGNYAMTGDTVTFQLNNIGSGLSSGDFNSFSYFWGASTFANGNDAETDDW